MLRDEQGRLLVHPAAYGFQALQDDRSPMRPVGRSSQEGQLSHAISGSR